MLSERIKALRKEKGISQRELSEIIGVSQQAVGSWETGRTSPDNDMITTLAKYFNVTTDYLLDNTPDNNITLNGSNHGAISGSGTAMVINGSPISVEQAEYCLMCHSLSSGAREQINNMIKMLHELEHKK